MYRLFWKIFFLFWIVNAAVFAIGVSLSHLFDDRVDRQRHRNFPIAQIAENAIYALEAGKMSRFLQRLHRKHGIEAWLLDLDNLALGAQKNLSRLPQVDNYPFYSRPKQATANRHVHGLELEAEDGRRYRFVAAYTVRPANRDVPKPIFMLGFFLVAIALTSFLVSGFITRPLRRLQRVVRRFAGGELDTRVNAHVACRKDAVGELGREFNVMAQRLTTTIESQRRLMRDISHELRTPLARMQVAATLAEDTSSGAEMPLQRIQLEIQRLDVLISQVLALARLESGTDKLECSPFDLLEMLQRVSADAEFEFAGDEKTIGLVLPAQLVINADRSQLRSAVENVLRNAMRHTADGTRVELSASRDEQQVTIAIRDGGPGVPEENLLRMFDAFFRCEDARDVRSGGHGVGLAITRGIVLAHGGSIKARNHVRGGLVVEIGLPFDKGQRL